MIQDIAPHQYRNEYQPIKPTANSILLCYQGRNLLLRREGEEAVSYTHLDVYKRQDHVEVQGVVLEEEYDEESEICVTTVKIETENGARTMKRPVGTYRCV